MNGYTDINSITDPTDFKSTRVPKLFEVDSLLRCHICKEFLSSPMLTHCGHTFCSGCIRRYLLNTPKCPICSKELRESNLCRNVVLEQLVISYKGLRKELLEKVQIQEEPKNVPQVTESLVIENAPVASTTPKPEVIYLDEEDSAFDDSIDEDLTILLESKKRKQTVSIDSILKRPKPPLQRKITTESGTCPICSKVFPIEILMGRHIDECLAVPKPSSNYASNSTYTNSHTSLGKAKSPSTEDQSYYQPKESNTVQQKLTKLDYSSLSTTQLKSKLSKLELPTNGTRNELETRYNEFLILWNANCDSVQPKNPKLLRSQLAKWESAIKVKANGTEKLGKAGWSDLIRQARSTMKSKD
ncbi:hypothetical protein WICPIJ_008173 [Wickerhamomyces pijperi]|uniref:Postreplication repair E3 ubiquitin-protein ligase RAD18 n=1 Tax=Wickerhamomyces pijperi TaxID=599730 RepID=A0A9P8PYJ2_WICPI|nr:hypothetical protein WICPIJ_008173 [Wickerhamomyces pijperi]